MRWFCWHDWSKWKTYRWEGTCTILWEKEGKRISKTKQARICLKCGKEVHQDVADAYGSEYAKVAPVQQST